MECPNCKQKVEKFGEHWQRKSLFFAMGWKCRKPKREK